MWRIGKLALDGRVVLGPMSGFSFGSYRRFMEGFGIAASVTEMVSADGLVHNPGRSGGYLGHPHGRPVGVQLFGSDPGTMAEAAGIALDIDPTIGFVDINMGCPVPKVTDRGAGSALMRDPALCGRIVGSVKDAVDVPVTAKVRLGRRDDMNLREVLDSLVSAGVDAVTVHPRTPEDRYAGSARYDLIAGLQDGLPIPLIVSGDVRSLDDAIRAMDVTGAAAVMVARGGVGNPYLVTRIDAYLRTGEVLPEPTASQQLAWCRELAGMVLEEKGDEAGIRALRSIAPRFLSGHRYCHEHRRALADVGTPEELWDMLDRIEAALVGR